MYKNTLMILPAKEIMETVLSVARNKYLATEDVMLLAVRLHRDIMNQESTVSDIELLSEYADEVQALILQGNVGASIKENTESADSKEVEHGYKQLNTIFGYVYGLISKVEELLSGVLSSSLLDNFYTHKCEPIKVRIYAGDLALTLKTNDSENNDAVTTRIV